MDGVVVAETGLTGSFDDFLAARGDALWRSAWLLTGDAHLAEDLVGRDEDGVLRIVSLEVGTVVPTGR